MLEVFRIIGLLFLVFHFVYSEYIDPCPHHNGFSEEEAEAVLKDWPGNLNLAKVNRSHKCYVTCILMYFDIVGTSGEVTLDKYFDSGVIDEFAFAPTLLRCRYEYREETDFCEHTFGIFNCFRQEKLLSKK
ncbi:general odorant-binding protein 57d [Drosophila subpulchrella]|uniref:general odorant-binding protein 57d n=1 Tax=Drosophila subpulchrella TaxID=1486046 RepID=UPI0018A1B2A2|nr:general odorant-binding protein 57d [Drosophila subpulchrella]